MGESLIDAAVPFFLILILVESFVGKKRKVYRWNDTITDLGTGILFSLTGVFVTVAALWVYEVTRTHFSLQSLFGVPEIPTGSPFHKGANGWEFLPKEAFSWLIVLLAVDFIYYWFHRATHEIHFLWACHVTHHSSEEFNLSVALRQCSFQRIFEYAFNLPLALAGVPWWMFLVCHGILKIYQFWVHTRLIGKLGWMEKYLLTPSHHRVHHGKDPEYLDRNHGGILILWDKWFGTFAEEKQEPNYGLTTQLGTFDPISANLHVYAELWRLTGQAASWKDKIFVLFKKPDWRPDSMGGPRKIPQVNRETLRKFDPPLSKWRKIYSILQFVLSAIAAVILLKLFKQDAISAEYFSVVGAWIIFSFYCIGLLLEGRKNALAWEGVRLLSVPFLLGYFLFRSGILFRV
ncbi:fatty acid hydroxylase family protein [Leptospira fletcheri]|uniref:Fatty acid hydroxylase family protein n=1 Tax=Leptospira fletcheri TaxID=2484981 RepID=A0A4R9GDR6_9LEPT|nr:sterol desaturase family protein [Leptospira fletcheri]TGK09881.1 fatty acid hydroxylase family protein [Leptospira fletcheri]